MLPIAPAPTTTPTPTARRLRTTTDPRPRPTTPAARDLMRDVPLVIPSGMSVGAAASLLDAAGTGVAPVVDSGGRCVGLFGATDYRRWLDRGRTRDEVVTEWQTIPPTPVPDEVRYHMTRRVAVATPEAGVRELLHRVKAVRGPYLVVLDRQGRPRGIVCVRDVLAAEAGDVEAGGESVPAGRRPVW